MESQDENILKLILNNLYLNEIANLQYICKHSFLLSCIVNRLAFIKQNRLYYKLEDKINIIYDHFRYLENKGFQTKYNLKIITQVNPHTLACVFNDGSLSLYDINTQKEIKSIRLSNSPIKLMTYKDGLFATLSYDNNIRVFNIEIEKLSDFICIESNSDVQKIILLDKDNLIAYNSNKIIKYDIDYKGLTDKLLEVFKLRKKSEVLIEYPNLLDMIMLNDETLLISNPFEIGIFNINFFSLRIETTKQ
jgi:hypothetical protein